MDTHQGAVFYQRSRPTSISSVLVMTFILGLGAGLSLSSVVAGTDHVVSVAASQWMPAAGHDMSAAAYDATHHDVDLGAARRRPRHERRGLRGDPRQLEMTVWAIRARRESCLEGQGSGWWAILDSNQ